MNIRNRITKLVNQLLAMSTIDIRDVGTDTPPAAGYLRLVNDGGVLKTLDPNGEEKTLATVGASDIIGNSAPVNDTIVNQVVTVTVPSGCTGSGSYDVTIVAPSIAPFFPTVNVLLDVGFHTTPALVAHAVVTALNAIGIGGLFFDNPSGGQIRMTFTPYAPNDSSASLNLPSACGIAAASSSITTAASFSASGTQATFPGQLYREGSAPTFIWWEADSVAPCLWSLLKPTLVSLGGATDAQGAKADVAVSFGAQSLTTAQQKQARDNIDSAALEAFDAVPDGTSDEYWAVAFTTANISSSAYAELLAVNGSGTVRCHPNPSHDYYEASLGNTSDGSDILVQVIVSDYYSVVYFSWNSNAYVVGWENDDSLAADISAAVFYVAADVPLGTMLEASPSLAYTNNGYNFPGEPGQFATYPGGIAYCTAANPPTWTLVDSAWLDSRITFPMAPSTGHLENFSGMLPAIAEFMKLDSITPLAPHYVGITGFGDSMAGGYTLGWLLVEMATRYGLGAVVSPNLSVIGPVGTSITYGTGAVVQSVGGGGSGGSGGSGYAYTPGSNWIGMAAGSSLSYTLTDHQNIEVQSNSSLQPGYATSDKTTLSLNDGCRKVAVYYVVAAGGGTLTATISQPNCADQVLSVSTAGADGFGKLEFPTADRGQAITITLAASSASLVVIGFAFFGSGGVVPWSSAYGGSTMEMQLAALTGGNFHPAYAGLFAELNTKLVYHAQRATDDSAWQANYATFFAAYAALGTITQLVLGEPPVEVAETPDITVSNAYLRGLCSTLGMPFIDQIAILKSYATLTKIGWSQANVTQAATAIYSGFEYQIVSSGGTNFTTVGAPNNNVGTVFTATGVGSGLTGAGQVVQCDPVHLGAAFQRFMAGWIMRECGDFRAAVSSTSVPLSQSSLRNEHLRGLMLAEAQTSRAHGASGLSFDGATTSGIGWTTSVNNDSGYRIDSGAALGYASGRILSLTDSAVADGFALTARSTNGLSVPAGTRAWLVISASATTITALTHAGIPAEAFGIEYAHAADVGATAIQGVVARLFYNTASGGLVNGPWTDPTWTYGGALAYTGLVTAIRFEPVEHCLYLYSAPNRDGAGGLKLVSSLLVSSGSPVNGQWLDQGMSASDAGNVPVATGNFTINDITARWGSLSAQF